MMFGIITNVHIKRTTTRLTIASEGEASVMVQIDNSDEWKLLFTFYPDEFNFREDQFLGLSAKEGLQLLFEANDQYLTAMSTASKSLKSLHNL